MKKLLLAGLAILSLILTPIHAPAAGAPDAMIGINVVLKTDLTSPILNQLGLLGKIRDVIAPIRAVTMQVKPSQLPLIRSLPFVVAANPDATRSGAPIDTVWAEDFIDGLSTWNLDVIDVTDFGFANRQLAYDGTGVYVAVLDTGLLDSWRQYFPEERIAEEYAISFGGGGGEKGAVSSQPNKWEHDQNSHGTHVTSTILGYSLRGAPVNGVAPMATVIPVKVLNQNGSGWSSVIARGIVYVADLKAGPLADYPVVINMSLGGPILDVVEKAAIDYAIAQGVILVASAGNNGTAGMGFPGAYAPVISVAAAGWIGEWTTGTWWYSMNVADPSDPNPPRVPTVPAEFYITDFSSRKLLGQDLDVAAPGSWVVGPYQVNSGQTSYYFLGGTSMAAPHVAGIVALMAEKDPTLTATRAETILESSAIPLSAGCLNVPNSDGSLSEICWGTDATGSGLANAAAALAAIP